MANAHLQTTLLNQHSLPVSQAWLTNFLSTSRQPPPPLPVLISTARFRIFASDIKSALAPGDAVLPADISNVNTKERRLASDVVVQVLDMSDIGTSKWSQVEAIERVERGEEVRGREVIRNVPIMNENDDADATGGVGTRARQRGDGPGQGNAEVVSAKKSAGPHKLVLQDAKGTNVSAFDMVEIPGCWIGEGGMSIGCKMLLKQGTLVRRGMMMLMPEKVVVMGGKIETWDKKWRDDRKKRLIAEVETLQGG